MSDTGDIDKAIEHCDVDWMSSCGRHFLTINGYAVSMETDRYRDADLVAKYGPTWTEEAIKFVAGK